MRSKKDADTIVVVTADSQEEMMKVLQDNREGWEEIKKPEPDALLEGMPTPNRAERRRQRFRKKAI